MGGGDIYIALLFNLSVRKGELSTLRPDRFTTKKDPVPIVSEAGWVPEPVCKGAENLARSRIWSDCPACSKSLYD